MACFSTSGTSPQFVRHLNSTIAFDLIGDELYSRYLTSYIVSPHSLNQFDLELKIPNNATLPCVVCYLLLLALCSLSLCQTLLRQAVYDEGIRPRGAVRCTLGGEKDKFALDMRVLDMETTYARVFGRRVNPNAPR